MSRDTGIEYAVKIIDKSQDEAITESIANEMQVLGYLPEHKHISKSSGEILKYKRHLKFSHENKSWGVGLQQV